MYIFFIILLTSYSAHFPNMKDIFSKVRRKSLSFLRKFIYHNYKLKPNKAYQLSKSYFVDNHNQDAQYSELFPDYTTNLPVPEGLLKAIPPYCRYDKLLVENSCILTVTTSYIIVALPNGRLYSNNIDMVAVITQDNALLGDVSLQYLPNRIARPEENNIFRQAYFTSPRKYKGTVFNMLAGGGPIINYGHWLIDVLPRIYLLKKSGWFDKVDWFVVPNYKYDFQKDSLKLLGIDQNKIIQGSDQLHITADVLIASTAPRGERSYLMPAWVVDFHRESFLNNQLISNKYPPLVYISRRDGTSRKVLNEQKLIDLLEHYGFKVYELSKLSFVEKISLFSYAKVILSVVGAGLSNVVYCQKGTKVIEIFPEVLVDTFNYNLAKLVEADYSYLICKSEIQAKKLTTANNADFTVDLDQLKKMLDDVFEMKPKTLQIG